jgi:hypothetical protein
MADGDIKTGVVYYRLKAVDASGNYSYSKALPIVFSNELNWIIAPNHSAGYYNLIFQANQGEKVSIEIFNCIGSLIRKEQFNASGFISQHAIDLRVICQRHLPGAHAIQKHNPDIQDSEKINFREQSPQPLP